MLTSEAGTGVAFTVLNLFLQYKNMSITILTSCAKSGEILSLC